MEDYYQNFHMELSQLKLFFKDVLCFIFYSDNNFDCLTWRTFVNSRQRVTKGKRSRTAEKG